MWMCFECPRPWCWRTGNRETWEAHVRRHHPRRAVIGWPRVETTDELGRMVAYDGSLILTTAGPVPARQSGVAAWLVDTTAGPIMRPRPQIRVPDVEVAA